MTASEGIPRRLRRRRGMSLFELSVVLVIGIVLAALAFLSSRGLVTRTRASRVAQEHRAVSRALQNYIMDHATLPPASLGLSALVQPTAYLASVPSDPFQPGTTPYLYLNLQHREIAAVVVSPGPDGQFDLPPELWRFASFSGAEPTVSKGPAEPIVRHQRMRSGLQGHGNAGAPASPESPGMTEAEAAILSTYLRLGRYDPERKGESGDIVTVIRN